MTERKAGLGESVNRRTLLVGVLGAGIVAFGGAVHDSLKMPRYGEALQALHTVQAAAAEIAKDGVDGRTTSEDTIEAILRRESSSIAEMKVALSEPLAHYATGEGRYASAGANMVDGLLGQIGREMFADTDQQMTTEITEQARPTLVFLIMALNQGRIGLGAGGLLPICQRYHRNAIAPPADEKTAEARQAT